MSYLHNTSFSKRFFISIFPMFVNYLDLETWFSIKTHCCQYQFSSQASAYVLFNPYVSKIQRQCLLSCWVLKAFVQARALQWWFFLGLLVRKWFHGNFQKKLWVVFVPSGCGFHSGVPELACEPVWRRDPQAAVSPALQRESRQL